MECYINVIYCPPNQSLGDGVVHLVIVGGTPFPPEMITLGVSTHGVILGSSLVVAGSFPPAVIRIVVNVYPIGETPALPLSSRLVGEIGSVPLKALLSPSCSVCCLTWY